MSEKFDAIVVGAGPAGSAAAYVMAKDGLKVLLVERGKAPGTKTVFGGRMYTHALNKLMPGFWKEAPVERFVVREVISFLTDESALNFDFRTDNFGKEPYNSVTLHRGKFDPWLAKKAEDAGALILSGVHVEDVVKQEGKVSGVVAGGDKFYCDVVVAADGATSGIAKKLGFRQEFKPDQFATACKEIIELPRETIEERFNLTGDEGAAYVLTGTPTHGIEGGGFLYTNKDTISIGTALGVRDVSKERIYAWEPLDRLKEHPYIKPLIKGGKTVEYSAHLIPEAAINFQGRLFWDGVLLVGDAAGFALNTGFSQRGTDFAIESGVAAAETIKKAKQAGTFSASALAYYEELLRESFVLQHLNTYRRAPEFLHNRRLYDAYPQVLCEFFEQLTKVDGSPKKKVRSIIRDSMRGKISLWSLIRDGINGLRSV